MKQNTWDNRQELGWQKTTDPVCKLREHSGQLRHCDVMSSPGSCEPIPAGTGGESETSVSLSLSLTLRLCLCLSRPSPLTVLFRSLWSSVTADGTQEWIEKSFLGKWRETFQSEQRKKVHAKVLLFCREAFYSSDYLWKTECRKKQSESCTDVLNVRGTCNNFPLRFSDQPWWFQACLLHKKVSSSLFWYYSR